MNKRQYPWYYIKYSAVFSAACLRGTSIVSKRLFAPLGLHVPHLTLENHFIRYFLSFQKSGSKLSLFSHPVAVSGAWSTSRFCPHCLLLLSRKPPSPSPVRRLAPDWAGRPGNTVGKDAAGSLLLLSPLTTGTFYRGCSFLPKIP